MQCVVISVAASSFPAISAGFRNFVIRLYPLRLEFPRNLPLAAFNLLLNVLHRF